MTNLLSLPPYHTKKIFDYLPLSSLCSIQRTCSIIYQRARNANLFREIIYSASGIRVECDYKTDFANKVLINISNKNSNYMIATAECISFSHIEQIEKLVSGAFSANPNSAKVQNYMLKLEECSFYAAWLVLEAKDKENSITSKHKKTKENSVQKKDEETPVQKAANKMIWLIENNCVFSLCKKAVMLLFRGWADGILKDMIPNSRMHYLVSSVLMHDMSDHDRSLLTIYQKCTYFHNRIPGVLSETEEVELHTIKKHCKSKKFFPEEKAILLLGFAKIVLEMNFEKWLESTQKLIKKIDLSACSNRTKYGILTFSILIQERNATNKDSFILMNYPKIYNHPGCTQQEKVHWLTAKCWELRNNKELRYNKDILKDLEYINKHGTSKFRVYAWYMKGDLISNTPNADLYEAMICYENAYTLPEASPQTRSETQFKHAQILYSFNKQNKSAYDLFRKVIVNPASSRTNVDYAYFYWAELSIAMGKKPKTIFKRFQYYLERVKDQGEFSKKTQAKFYQAINLLFLKKEISDKIDKVAYYLFDEVTQASTATLQHKCESFYHMAILIYTKRHEGTYEQIYDLLEKAILIGLLNDTFKASAYVTMGQILFHKQVIKGNGDKLAYDCFANVLKISFTLTESFLAHMYIGFLGYEKRVPTITLKMTFNSLLNASHFEGFSEILKNDIQMKLHEVRRRNLSGEK